MINTTTRAATRPPSKALPPTAYCTAISPEPPIQSSKPDSTNSDNGRQQNATARGLDPQRDKKAKLTPSIQTKMYTRAVLVPAGGLKRETPWYPVVPVSHHSRVDLYHVPAKLHVNKLIPVASSYLQGSFKIKVGSRKCGSSRVL